MSGLESPVNWSALQKVVASTGLRIIGVSGCKDARLKAEIDEMGLPLLTEGKEKLFVLRLLRSRLPSLRRKTLLPSQKHD